MTGIALLTGATGFVGRQVLQALTERGARVRAVVREGRQGELTDRRGIETIVATPDLFNESAEWWAEICAGTDTVIHMAWYAEPGKYLQSTKNIDCLIGTLQLAKGSARAGVKRFIGIGTCLEYDLKGGYLSVDTPLQPVTLYAGAKAATFIALSQFLPIEDVSFAWCRLFYLYGPGEDERRLVPYLHKRLQAGHSAELTSGKQVRDYIDVRDAAQLIVDNTFSSVQGPINICSGVPITVRELAERIATEYGRLDLLKFGLRTDNPQDPQTVVGVKNGRFIKEKYSSVPGEAC